MARRDSTPLGEAREAAGLSQDQAAALIKVTKATIQNWERGRRRRISGDHLERAAEVYRITTREFLALMDAGAPSSPTEEQTDATFDAVEETLSPGGESAPPPARDGEPDGAHEEAPQPPRA